jgi:hypothetical protein
MAFGIIYSRDYLGFKILREYLLGKEWLATVFKQLQSSLGRRFSFS